MGPVWIPASFEYAIFSNTPAQLRGHLEKHNHIRINSQESIEILTPTLIPWIDIARNKPKRPRRFVLKVHLRQRPHPSMHDRPERNTHEYKPEHPRQPSAGDENQQGHHQGDPAQEHLLRGRDVEQVHPSPNDPRTTHRHHHHHKRPYQERHDLRSFMRARLGRGGGWARIVCFHHFSIVQIMEPDAPSLPTKTENT